MLNSAGSKEQDNPLDLQSQVCLDYSLLAVHYSISKAPNFLPGVFPFVMLGAFFFFLTITDLLQRQPGFNGLSLAKSVGDVRVCTHMLPGCHKVLVLYHFPYYLGFHWEDSSTRLGEIRVHVLAETVWVEGPLSTCMLGLLQLCLMAQERENLDYLHPIVTKQKNQSGFDMCIHLLVGSGEHNKMPQPGQFKQQKRIRCQFWRLEVSDRDVGRFDSFGSLFPWFAFGGFLLRPQTAISRSMSHVLVFSSYKEGYQSQWVKAHPDGFLLP